MNIIEQLLRSQSRHTLVAAQGKVELHNQGTRFWLYTSGEAIQSVLDTAKPQLPALPYQTQMLCVLAMLDTLPTSVLSLGLGIGAFEHAFAAMQVMPQQWLSVEYDSAVIGLLQHHLPVPPGVDICHADALTFLIQNKQRYDLIFCDLFVGEQHAELINQQCFFSQLRRAMNDNGCVAINLAPSSAEQLSTLLGYAKQFFAGGALAKLPPFANVILYLSCNSAMASDFCFEQSARLQQLWSMPFNQKIQSMYFF